MPIFKYHNFEEAERALLRFQPGAEYYKRISELFGFFSKLSPPAYPAGIFKYKDLDSANRQKIEWNIQNALKRMEKRKKK